MTAPWIERACLARAALVDALQLAENGLPVFPCLQSKAPACPGGFKAASCIRSDVERLWMQWPGPLIGVPTGEASGLFVVDVDTAKHQEAADWLERHAPYLPDTRTHITQSGGCHLLFRHLPGLKNSQGKIAPGIDTRGEGGFVIWWPAALGQDLDGLSRLVPDLPDWIAEALKPAPPPPVTRSEPPAGGRLGTSRCRIERARDLQPIIRCVATAPIGQRNAICFWGACRVAELSREGRIGRDNAIDLIVAAAAHAGLPRQEAFKTAWSAFRIIGA